MDCQDDSLTWVVWLISFEFSQGYRPGAFVLFTWASPGLFEFPKVLTRFHEQVYWQYVSVNIFLPTVYLGSLSILYYSENILIMKSILYSDDGCWSASTPPPTFVGIWIWSLCFTLPTLQKPGVQREPELSLYRLGPVQVIFCILSPRHFSFGHYGIRFRWK